MWMPNNEKTRRGLVEKQRPRYGKKRSNGLPSKRRCTFSNEQRRPLGMWKFRKTRLRSMARLRSNRRRVNPTNLGSKRGRFF